MTRKEQAMKRALVMAVLLVATASNLSAQGQTPFKLGTFEQNGQIFLGLVIRDSLVANIAQANAALAGDKPAIPTNMTELIARYEAFRPPGPVPEPIPGVWERTASDVRQNPYVFPKLASTIIADGEAIRMPAGRERVDWECELAVVIGQQANRVPVGRAAEYIFGYTLQNDVSDRGGRADRRHGSDWFLQKNHDTFAPLGPFIVPRGV